MIDASRVTESVVTAAGAVTPALLVMDISDLNWPAIALASIVAGVAGLVASVSAGIRAPEETRYTWRMAVVDFAVGATAGMLMFALASSQELSGELKLALMVASGWSGQWALDRGKRLISRVFPS
jgi:ABC-type enterobactin transport system permease subunit